MPGLAAHSGYPLTGPLEQGRGAPSRHLADSRRRGPQWPVHNGTAPARRRRPHARTADRPCRLCLSRAPAAGRIGQPASNPTRSAPGCRRQADPASAEPSPPEARDDHRPTDRRAHRQPPTPSTQPLEPPTGPNGSPAPGTQPKRPGRPPPSGPADPASAERTGSHRLTPNQTPAQPPNAKDQPGPTMSATNRCALGPGPSAQPIRPQPNPRLPKGNATTVPTDRRNAPSRRPSTSHSNRSLSAVDRKPNATGPAQPTRPATQPKRPRRPAPSSPADRHPNPRLPKQRVTPAPTNRRTRRESPPPQTSRRLHGPNVT